MRLRRDEGYRWGDVAVFYRTNAQSRAIEEELVRQGVPYKVVGGARFYERREVKDMLAYLHAIANPDDEVSLKRVLNVPRRGVGDTSLGRLDAWAAAKGDGVFGSPGPRAGSGRDRQGSGRYRFLPGPDERAEGHAGRQTEVDGTRSRHEVDGTEVDPAPATTTVGKLRHPPSPAGPIGPRPGRRSCFRPCWTGPTTSRSCALRRVHRWRSRAGWKTSRNCSGRPPRSAPWPTS